MLKAAVSRSTAFLTSTQQEPTRNTGWTISVRAKGRGPLSPSSVTTRKQRASVGFFSPQSRPFSVRWPPVRGSGGDAPLSDSPGRLREGASGPGPSSRPAGERGGRVQHGGEVRRQRSGLRGRRRHLPPAAPFLPSAAAP